MDTFPYWHICCVMDMIYENYKYATNALKIDKGNMLQTLINRNKRKNEQRTVKLSRDVLLKSLMSLEADLFTILAPDATNMLTESVILDAILENPHEIAISYHPVSRPFDSDEGREAWSFIPANMGIKHVINVPLPDDIDKQDAMTTLINAGIRPIKTIADRSPADFPLETRIAYADWKTHCAIQMFASIPSPRLRNSGELYMMQSSADDGLAGYQARKEAQQDVISAMHIFMQAISNDPSTSYTLDPMSQRNVHSSYNQRIETQTRAAGFISYINRKKTAKILGETNRFELTDDAIYNAIPKEARERYILVSSLSSLCAEIIKEQQVDIKTAVKSLLDSGITEAIRAGISIQDIAGDRNSKETLCDTMGIKEWDWEH